MKNYTQKNNLYNGQLAQEPKKRIYTIKLELDEEALKKYLISPA